MLNVEIPGREPLILSHAIFDFNGTIGLDGHVEEKVLSLLPQVRTQLNVVFASADT